MASKRSRSLAFVMLGALASSIACGTSVASEHASDTTVAQRVIQDPDNPASRSYAAPVAGPAINSVIRDPENPNWSGSIGTAAGPSGRASGLR